LLKKFIIFLTIVTWMPVVASAADTKVEDETEMTDIQGGDVFYIVDDPGGTPAARKISATNVFDMIDTFAELDAIVTDKALTNKTDGAVWSGVHDFGGATSVEVPNGTSPTVNATGEIAVDTNLYSTSPQGCLVIYDGAQQGNLVCTTDTPGNDEIPKFDSTTGLVTWEADAGAGGGANNFSWTFEPQTAKLPSSNPMAIDAGNLRWRGLYDDTTQECAQWSTTLKPYQAGTLQAQILYTLETTSTSDVVAWDLSIMCVTGGSPEGDAQDVDSDSFGTVDSIDSGAISSTAGRLVRLTDASLNGDSCSEDDLFIVKLCRDVANDGTTDDVELREVTIFE
jgi:hypothetical protein